MLRRSVTLLVVALLLAMSAIARADAVPPAPSVCPRGEVGVTSHAGGRCEKVAPKDCPPGWRGVVGGTCMLTPCETDQQCEPSEACTEHSVCLAPYEDDEYDYGEEEREKHGQTEPRGAAPSFVMVASDGNVVVLRSPPLLAAPPLPRKKRPTPIFRYDAVNLCSADVPCAPPRTCQAEKLCAPKGARAVAFRGTNVTPARVARKTATALVNSDARPSETTAPMKRGCAGCASAGTDGAPWGVVLAFAALAALTSRRSRSPK